MKSLQLFALLLLVILSAPIYAATYVVTPDGTGDFPTIEAAINACVDADTVLLACGTFTGTGNRDIDFLGKAITVRSQSNDPEACVIDCEGTEDEPHRGFIFQSGEGSESVLQGVTIANGYDVEVGGGMLCHYSTPTITNCLFSENKAVLGGGIFIWDASPTLMSCMFSQNMAYTPSGFGGGEGGGAYCYESSVTFGGCIFSENTSAVGGGLSCAKSSLTIEACVFRGNATLDSYDGGMGGGIYCFQTPLTLMASTFFENTAGKYGGAAAFESSSPSELMNCTFSRNGAVFRAGGIYCTSDSPAAIDHCIIVFSSQGEAIYPSAEHSNPTLTCCDIYGNAGGDWVGGFEDQLDTNGNFSEDPRFCDIYTGDLRLCANSSCLPENNTCEELIGAEGKACGPCETPTLTVSWGQIKAKFR